MVDQSNVAIRSAHSPLQRRLRRRTNGKELEAAVAQAADSLFNFTHRANNAKALWSDTMVVWLGRSTFLHWALHDDDINIPWIVAKACDVPGNSRDLRQQVQTHLTAYFATHLSSLPRKSPGNWLPLP